MKLRMAVATVALGLSGMGAAHAASLTYTFTADNAYSVYISSSDSTLGTLLFSTLGGPAQQWSTPAPAQTVGLSGSVEYLQIIGYNYTTSNGLYPPSQGTSPKGDNPNALLGSLTITGGGYVFPNKTTSVSTDTANWLAAEVPIPNPDLVTNVTWVPPNSAPQSYGTNGVAPWGTVGGGISPSAEWIWSDPDNFAYADFSIEITQTPLPATWSMLLIGLAGFGFVGHRHNKKLALSAAA